MHNICIDSYVLRHSILKHKVRIVGTYQYEKQDADQIIFYFVISFIIQLFRVTDRH